MKKAVLFEKKGENLVQCTCCRHRCMIINGATGKCGVRRNIDGELFLLVYGKAIAVHVDPVEKKPMFHFLPGERIFSFGTVGCNFRCQFCQNWDISQATERLKEMYKNPVEAGLKLGELCDQGQDLPPKKVVEYCLGDGIPMVSYTYNEPTIFTEYAHDAGVLARKVGLKNIYVSNGYETEECLEYMKDFCDGINIDIKSFNKEFYQKVCGANLDGVLKTVKKAWEMGFLVECTTLVIPEQNDSDKELRGIAEFIAGVSVDIPWHVTAFHPDYKMSGKQTPASTLERAWGIGKEAGLKFVYSGNIPGMGHENTECPKCKKVLIKRFGMSCVENNLKVDKDGWGRCPKCKEKIPGIWK